jgi:RNA polymerase sigma-54 factor
MLIQLRSLREEGRGNGLAETMLETHFDEVVRSRYGKLARAMGVTVDKAKETIDFMRQCLNPYPANQFRPPWVGKARNSKAAVRPDVAIHRTNVGYEIEILGGESSVLGVNEKYRETYDAIQRGDTSLSEEERKHIVEYVERAELFIQHLKQRRRTLKQITRCIAEMQQGFLDTGSRAYLIPLTRTHIAETLGIHESTVSRATAKKYVQLPNEEVVPFDLFFNGSVSIKSEIEKIIAAEDPAHPVSDQRIVEILAERGISVARRTVVKYREGLKILSSTRRRR